MAEIKVVVEAVCNDQTVRRHAVVADVEEGDTVYVSLDFGLKLEGQAIRARVNKAAK